MRTSDESQVIDVIELLSNLIAKEPTGTTR